MNCVLFSQSSCLVIYSDRVSVSRNPSPDGSGNPFYCLVLRQAQQDKK